MSFWSLGTCVEPFYFTLVSKFINQLRHMLEVSASKGGICYQVPAHGRIVGSL